MAAPITLSGFCAVLALTSLAVSGVRIVLAGDPPSQQSFIDVVNGAVPGIGELLQKQIHGVVQFRVVALVVSLAGLLLTGIGAVNAAGWALGRVFRIQELTGFLKKRLWALGSLVTIGLIVIASGGIDGVVQGLHTTG